MIQDVLRAIEYHLKENDIPLCRYYNYIRISMHNDVLHIKATISIKEIKNYHANSTESSVMGELLKLYQCRRFIR